MLFRSCGPTGERARSCVGHHVEVRHSATERPRHGAAEATTRRVGEQHPRRIAGGTGHGERSAAGEFSLGQLTFLPGDRAD